MIDRRDTQFSGFAQALTKELDEIVGDVTAWGVKHNIDDETRIAKELSYRWKVLIARRAYDLVAHTLWNTASLDLERLSIAENVERIPDLPVLPEEDAE